MFPPEGLCKREFSTYSGTARDVQQNACEIAESTLDLQGKSQFRDRAGGDISTAKVSLAQNFRGGLQGD